MHPSPVFVGIDISKAKLDVALRPRDQTWQIDYDEANIAQLVGHMPCEENHRPGCHTAQRRKIRVAQKWAAFRHQSSCAGPR